MTTGCEGTSVTAKCDDNCRSRVCSVSAGLMRCGEYTLTVRKAVNVWAHRAASFVEHPRAMMLRRTGVISDLYIKLDKPWLHELDIKTVLDVGGNIGRFSKTIEHLLPEARIIAFEPLPSCFAQMNELMESCSKYQGLNIGLGDEETTIEMAQNAHSPSSSFLELDDMHKSAFPYATKSGTAQVRVRRLDDVANELKITPNTMIKVDVQGFEDKVIAGGLKTFSDAKVLLLELSFQHLYQGQPLFDDVYSTLRDLGFAFHGGLNLMQHPQSGLPLDADCIFVNESN